MELTPAGRAAIDNVAIGRTFTSDEERLQWMVESLHRRMSFEQETRLHRALGITKVQPTGEELVTAAETRQRDLEQSREQVRALESGARSFEAKESELAQLRGELEGLRRDGALERARERVRLEDAAEEAAEEARIRAWMKKSPGEQVI